MRSRASVAAVVERVGRSAEIARAINEASEGDSLDVGQRTAELLMARLYDVAAREDVDAKTLQAVSRSPNSTLGTIASARGLRGRGRPAGYGGGKGSRRRRGGRARPPSANCGDIAGGDARQRRGGSIERRGSGEGRPQGGRRALPSPDTGPDMIDSTPRRALTPPFHWRESRHAVGMAWWRKHWSWIRFALTAASQGGVVVDWVMPNARFLLEIMASLEISRAAPAAYTFFIIFFGFMLVVFGWGPVNSFRPSRKFGELHQQILDIRESLNKSVRDREVEHTTLYPTYWELKLRLRRLGIIIPNLKTATLKDRIRLIALLTRLAICAEYKDIDEARTAHENFYEPEASESDT